MIYFYLPQKNIIHGYISRGKFDIKIISLRHFESIQDLIEGTDIEYKFICKKCDSITKEIIANLKYVLILCKRSLIWDVLFS